MNIIEGRRSDIGRYDAYVLVDVFRSTSTIPIILKNGAEYVIPAFRLSTARSIARRNPDYVTVGERYGFKIPQFQFGNSPADVMNESFKGKVVIFTSTNGTRVLEKIRDRENVLIASFVNFSATRKALNDFGSVAIVMSGRPDGSADEDKIFSEMLSRSLSGEKVDVERYVAQARDSKGARRLQMIGYARDVIPATSVDIVKFPVVFRDGKIIKMA